MARRRWNRGSDLSDDHEHDHDEDGIIYRGDEEPEQPPSGSGIFALFQIFMGGASEERPRAPLLPGEDPDRRYRRRLPNRPLVPGEGSSYAGQRRLGSGSQKGDGEASLWRRRRDSDYELD